MSSSIAKDSKIDSINVEDDEKPIKFTTSPAAKWSSTQTFKNVTYEDRLWYQPYIVISSLAIFMIYFFYFREENDIDKKFNKSLFEHFEDMQKNNPEMILKPPPGIAVPDEFKKEV